ncbi:MAG: hypothetical protein SVO01_00560 [Thermotogota bacterium]|nr:hypothetical protein [Thermotogota bacterium]
MAVFGSSYNFSITTNEIINEALIDVGAIAVGQTPDAAMYAHGRRKLNMMVKQWMGPPNYKLPGLKMWQREVGTLTLTAKSTFLLCSSGGDCDIDPPVHIISASRRNTDNVDSLLTPIGVQEYRELANKSAVGTPTKYYYEQKLDGGYLYLNTIPSDTTDTIVFSYLQPIQDFDSASQNPDFPQQYYLALALNLAVLLAPAYIGEVPGWLQHLANDSLAQANTFYPETSVEYFQPELD